MIPLVSMFWESWNAQLVHECQQQVEVVIKTMDELCDWSLAARRSREVVSKMYEASKRSLPSQATPKLGPHGGMVYGLNGMNGHLQPVEGQDVQQMEMFEEESMVLPDYQSIWDLDGMLWSNLPDDLEMPFDEMPSAEYEYKGSGFDGNSMMHQK